MSAHMKAPEDIWRTSDAQQPCREASSTPQINMDWKIKPAPLFEILTLHFALLRY